MINILLVGIVLIKIEMLIEKAVYLVFGLDELRFNIFPLFRFNLAERVFLQTLAELGYLTEPISAAFLQFMLSQHPLDSWTLGAFDGFWLSQIFVEGCF